MNWLSLEPLQVIDMPEHNPGQMGGTMRLGKRRTIFKSNNSVLRKKNFEIHKVFNKLLICSSI